MKQPHRSSASAKRLLALAGALALSTAAHAQQYWDADTNTTGSQDGSGTWATGVSSWWNGTSNVTFSNNTTGNIFGSGSDGASGAYAVSVGNSFTSLNNLQFLNSGYALSSNGTERIIGSTSALVVFTIGTGKSVDFGNNITLSQTTGSTNEQMRFAGNGTFNFNSGSKLAISGGGQINIGASDGSTSPTLVFNAGSTTALARVVNIQRGEIRVEGGSFNSTGTGSALNLGTTTASSGNPVSFTINSGSATFAGNIVVGNNTAGTGGGALNLNGGTLTAAAISTTASTSVANTRVVNLNGGTLLFAATSAAYLTNFHASAANHGVFVQNGGAKFDTNSFDVTLGSVLRAGTGSGGLTKLGAGTLTLSNAAQGYTGATTISAGTLAVQASTTLASTQINIASGATFNTTARTSFGNSTVNLRFDLGAIAPGSVFLNAAAADLGTLTFNFTTGTPDTALSGYNIYDSTGAISFSSLALSGNGFSGTFNGSGIIRTLSSNGYDFSFDTTTGVLTAVAAVPEPSTFAALAGLGVMGFAANRRRRRA